MYMSVIPFHMFLYRWPYKLIFLFVFSSLGYGGCSLLWFYSPVSTKQGRAAPPHYYKGLKTRVVKIIIITHTLHACVVCTVYIES